MMLLSSEKQNVTPQPTPFGLMGPTATELHSPTQYMYYSIPHSKGDSANGDGESESRCLGRDCRGV